MIEIRKLCAILQVQYLSVSFTGVLKTVAMQNKSPIDNKLIQSWIEARLSPAEVEQKLRSGGFAEEHIAAYMDGYKKECCAARRFKGFLYISLGGLLGFISCLLSIFHVFPAFSGLILFGLTSVAVLLVFVGLYFLFE
jgi:hypothetical protein